MHKWEFASNSIVKPSSSYTDCSDDEVSSYRPREGLECPICCESFNIVKNVPYVLWCGHTLCRNCVLGLQWAVVKFLTIQMQLPLLISCPWCQLLSVRLVYKGNLNFPRKNFFLLWMIESMTDDRSSSHSSFCADSHSLKKVTYIHQEHQPASSVANYFNVERIKSSLCRSLAFFVNITAKFPHVIIFLLIVLYAIPASAAILALYILITVLFGLPSFFMLYFAYPSLDWLIREIISN
ncbi:hypothetical protein J5N97_010296 [Dioscorea zingiberensis]|uniref:RING-type domain-containing protein n=1 Tax=Dioscorea zingiberensis TaxID=325984 RepID=A0A9D5CYG3_9LILI|nr:hypothetical protein J5N97_010296 [Dioscorea zingiberensis]